jgi:predicted amidophosphoribosyltransferase
VLIAYVPTAPQRVRERGYDQAALIAKELAIRSKLPYHTLLARTGTQRQLGQQRAVRKEQMTGAFRSLDKIDLQDKHVLLIDDVLTTGATCEAAARALRQAGAKRVSAAVFAVA